MAWIDYETAIQRAVYTATGLSTDNVIWAEQKDAPRPEVPFISMKIINISGGGFDWTDQEDVLLTVDDTVDTVDFANNELDIASHGLATGDGPIQLTTTGTLPTGLATSTNYWVIRIDAGTIQLASTFVNAHNGVAVSFSDVGAGTHTISNTSSTATSGAEIAQIARGPRTLNISIQCYGNAESGAIGANSPMAILNKLTSKIHFPSVHSILTAAGLSIALFDTPQNISGLLDPAIFEPRAVVNARFHIANEESETGTYIETITDPVRET